MSLFAFVLLTYPALPVLSFAALLLVMSLVDSTIRRPWANRLSRRGAAGGVGHVGGLTGVRGVNSHLEQS